MLIVKRIFSFLLILTGVYFSAQIKKKDSLRNISEVVIKKVKHYKDKKENPAYAILQEVWQRKKSNVLDKFQSYTYDEYEKIEFSANNIDSAFTKKKIFRKMDFIFDYADSTANGKLSLPFFINEAIYKNYGENQPQKREKRRLEAQKTSGFQDNEVIALTAKNLFKETNLRGNTINFFNIGFESPVSSTGFSVYDYALLGTATINGQECYHIQYEPRRKEALAFRGHIYIAKKDYDIIKVTLLSPRNLNLNFVNGVYAEFEFSPLSDDAVLPYRIYAEYDLSLSENKNQEAKSFTAKRTLRYTNYQFNQPIKSDVFVKDEPVATSEMEMNDEYWKKARTEALNKSEKAVYEMMDRVNKVPKYQTFLNLVRTVDTGFFNIGKSLDIGNIQTFFGKNDVEGTRLKLAMRTFFSQNDTWRFEAYGAYGTKDNKFKYGSEIRALLDSKSRFIVGLGHRQDVVQLGAKITMAGNSVLASALGSSLLSRIGNGKLSNITQTHFFASIEPFKNIQFQLEAIKQNIYSANPDFDLRFYKGREIKTDLDDTQVSLSILAKPGAKYSKIGLDRKEHPTLSPTFLLRYTRGFAGVLSGDFTYNKLQLLYKQPILTGTWGKSIVTLEAGKIFNTVPLALQYVIPGNQSYGIEKNTFSQLNYYEFVTDTYATLDIEHHFNGKILSYIPLINKLNLREVGLFRAATGTLSEASKNINLNNKYTAPSSKIYYEYGFGIENIGWGNFRLFRVDFNWRGNYLKNPNTSKFGMKFGVQLSI